MQRKEAAEADSRSLVRLDPAVAGLESAGLEDKNR
ncbi:hypothetical protein X970_19555 [Pseudomonas monteilii SB3101]|uniref:Uncharacterized protein n=1 Tax=Pseudomonas monteilii SB3101 TaxID=1435058 RepID=V9V8Z3_9PSED|nr:hypothetical protein X969_19920 [Pseudomonas monteilii SB3078]AHC91167.1 hypothetical protein X970_19555 [Pseudomonas monteilii SB3101]